MTERKIIGNTAGRDIEEVTVTNDKGLSFSAMTYGATITKLIVPDKNGKGTDSPWHMETMKLPPTERAKARSKTFHGIARAMAEQWGGLAIDKPAIK